MNSHATRLPKEGEAAYFMHLHLGTVDLTTKRKHAHKEDHWIMQVEGKARPMLVIRSLPKSERGRTWFWALPITKSGTDGFGKIRDNVQYIGNCLNNDVESFVELEIHEYPENLLHCGDGSSPLLTPCNVLAFRSAFSIVIHKVQGGRPPVRG